jgi:predicted esterase
MATPLFETHTHSVALECRYLLHLPAEPQSDTLLFLALHGYSSNPETMLRLTLPFAGNRHIVASLQAPNQHYVASGLPSADSVAGYNWGIRDHWSTSIRLHHDMVLQVLRTLRERFKIAPQRCVLVGFSQPVGMNYRFIGTYPAEVGGVIGICGGLPRDWEEPKYQPISAPILHISRDEDEFYPVPLVSQFPDRLRKRASDVEFHLLPGQHRFPSKAAPIVQHWIARVFGD